MSWADMVEVRILVGGGLDLQWQNGNNVVPVGKIVSSEEVLVKFCDASQD